MNMQKPDKKKFSCPERHVQGAANLEAARCRRKYFFFVFQCNLSSFQCFKSNRFPIPRLDLRCESVINFVGCLADTFINNQYRQAFQNFKT